MKRMHGLLMGLCLAIVVIALAAGASIGLPLLIFIVGCLVMMWMMMRMMGGGHRGEHRR